MGRAAAVAFATEGADVAFSYLPAAQSDADEVARLIERAGRKAVPLPGDLRDENLCNRLVADAVRELAGLDILVSNATRQQAVADIAEMSTEQFDATFKSNIYAMFWLTKAALPHIDRAVRIHRELRLRDLDHDTAPDRLECLPRGVMLVDATSRVVFANAAARALLADSQRP